MGNILMQAYGCHALSSLTEIRRVVRDSSKLETYMPEDTDMWEEAYGRFCLFLDSQDISGLPG